MSGKLEKQDSQRSHLTSFTMKLMDKFHSPKIKRTPSKKGKPLEITIKANSEKPPNKTLNRLEEQEKEVVSALRYFKTIVDKMVIDKKVLEMLPGSASKVLEAILPLVQVDPRIQQSSAITSCLNQVYQSLANLIRWSDQVILKGVNLEDKERVMAMIKAVLDGIKELVKLTIEKQEQPSPTSPVKPSPPTSKTDSATELPLTDREKEILTKTTPMTRSLEIIPDSVDGECAPPKPPLPGIRIMDHSSVPPLPPKKRTSAPSPTRVAVVSPISRAASGSSLPNTKQDFDGLDCYLQRRLSGGSHSYSGESPRVSPCNSMGKLSKSDEQLSSLDNDSGQCSQNTSCETLDNPESYDPDYDFLHQDLSTVDQIPLQLSGTLSPLPESAVESSSPLPGQTFTSPLCTSQTVPAWRQIPQTDVQALQMPPALPEKKRRSATSSDSSGYRVSYERFPSQYDNISEEEMQNSAVPAIQHPPFAVVSPRPQGMLSISVGFPNIDVSESAGVPEKPPPLPEKKKRNIHAYMQFVEDYSEPQPHVFYQTPQNEHIYEQRNKRFQEVYGFNDSFSSTDSSLEILPPPVLPPKQRQLQASYSAASYSSSFSSSSFYLQQSKVLVVPEGASTATSISMSVSNSFLSRHNSLSSSSFKSVFRSYSQDFVPHHHTSASPSLCTITSHFPAVHQSRSSDLTLPGSTGILKAAELLECSHDNAKPVPVCLPPESAFPTSLQTSSSESNSDDAGEGEYVNLYSSNHTNGDLSHPEAEIPMCADADSVGSLSEQEILHHNCPKSANEKENQNQDRDDRRGETPNSPDLDQSDVADELSLIDHEEIVARLTLKQEGEDGPEVRGGSVDILIVHATETDRKDLVLYCEAFLTTYRTFIPPEEIIKKLHYRYEKFCHCPDTFKKRVSKNTFFLLVRVVDELCLVELSDDILKLLMELVFRLVCSGELSLARVLRKNILDKVDQKKTVKYASLMKPLAARGVAARPGTLHDFHSHEIAEQLTLLDAELFYKIEIPEVLLWAKEQNEEKSPNLTEFTEHFNNMSYWVRSIIIQQEKAQDRERLLLKFIKIMKHLRKLNNFNSYLAILSALDSAPIRRLEWQKQTSEGLAEYCTLIDSSSSFRAYRAALAEVEPPCIPYLGLILQDLTFVHLGNPDLIDGKINFSKRWQQFNILDSMRCFQQVHYELKRIDDIVIFFNDFSDHLAEEALWELSLKIKPRNIQRRKTEREEKT
ncbi:rap guanine nucleotide exchange factor 1-like isoform X1 [Chiloscyllium plagiosum]|uniref:rap guanine nucleotide exchange factor 1-like isoform X1 n=1 Tax=Chiloscyllium plagiosum TaxID=36176 RepID=UPI001CB7CD56|nr:rap guanine nucleotide exchange factor 1-like isoform X1 [Chiloscyllium plagiosum]